jgi:L-threonine kinase
MNYAVGVARCPGTCGEWVQGARNGIPFLVDCPIDRFSEAKVSLSRYTTGWDLPTEKTKVFQALELLKRDLSLPKLSGKVEFSQQLPEGKGMASSTADITAAASAVLIALGENPVPEYLARLALQIEPSDSVMFSGISEIEHVEGRRHQVLGPPLPALFLALDWGGIVDTKAFNARPELSEHYRRSENIIRKAYRMAKEGIEQSDLEKLAAAGTISARCNLEINPKSFFEPFLVWVRQRGGLGLITAHSGTLLAGVFPQEGFDGKLNSLLLEAKQRFDPVSLDFFSSHSGGVQAHKLNVTENAG